MPGRYERVCVGWHCAKVKGHAELKIEKSFIYDFPKLHHSSPNSFGANVHLRQIFFKMVKVIERSRDVTPRSKVEKSKGRPRSPCPPNMVQFRPLFPELRHLESGSSTKLVFELVRALSERKPTCEFWTISGYFSSVIVVTAQVGTFVQGRGQRSNGAINRNKHFFRSFCRGF